MSRSAQTGFTLLEMMISFVLVSLLFLALFSGFNTISRSWEAAETRMLKTEDRRLIGEFLRSQLSQMMVVKLQGDDGPVHAFEGESTVIRYAAPLQPLQHSGGIYLIELSVARERSAQKLEMRYATYRPELTWDEAFESVKPVLVYKGLSEVRFEYFASESIDDDPSWQTSWVDQAVYPLLLKITMEDGDGQPWPLLLVNLPQMDEYVGG